MSEYVAATYPTAIPMFNVRLGAYPIHLAGTLPMGVNAGALSSFRRYVDCIVRFPDRLRLIEAKIVLDVDAPAKLELYKQLLPSTPELQTVAKLPVDMECVAAVVDPVVIALWSPRGIAFSQYAPSWLTVQSFAGQLSVSQPALAATKKVA